jgi:hypothetical protein
MLALGGDSENVNDRKYSRLAIFIRQDGFKYSLRLFRTNSMV